MTGVWPCSTIDRRRLVPRAGAERDHDADAAVAQALRSGDEAAFVAAVERFRRELQLHCYRMLGSLEDSEDLVQETVLRAWRARAKFEGRSTLRAWLYRIATNACLDALQRRRPRLLPPDVAPAAQTDMSLAQPSELPWLDPYPETLLGSVASSERGPESQLVDKETVELAFMAAIQHLPPRRRAVLVLRDVLEWSAKDTAATLEMTVASVNSTLQRARATLKERLPARRLEWERSAHPNVSERVLLSRYMQAHEQGDVDKLAALLREDARVSTPPYSVWYDGREAFMRSARRGAAAGRYRYLPTRANGQPAAASYIRRGDDELYRPLAIDILRVEDGLVAELTIFVRPDLFSAFGLPSALG
jgi:RNA polymerase sigma-70 factor (ECF subfamily)